jgi:hypothetical protein
METPRPPEAQKERREKKAIKARWLLLLPLAMGMAAHFMKRAEGVGREATSVPSAEQAHQQAETLRQAHRAKQALETLLAASCEGNLSAQEESETLPEGHFVNFKEVRLGAQDLLSFPVADRLHASPRMSDEEYAHTVLALDPDSSDAQDLGHWMTLQRTPGLFEEYEDYVQGMRMEMDENALHIYHETDETFEDMVLSASYQTSPNGAFRIATVGDREGDPNVYAAYEEGEYDPSALAQSIKSQLQGVVIRHLQERS